MTTHAIFATLVYSARLRRVHGQRLNSQLLRECRQLALDDAATLMQLGGLVVDNVSFSPINGRLRLALGSTIEELAGKTILLAPTVDRSQHMRWVCVPVDIPAKYLPQECRRA